jgi:hypothetical protein
MSTPDTTHPRNSAVRPVLWLLLVVTMAGNAATSFGATNVVVSLAFGAGTLLCAAGLAVSYLRGRR